MLESFEDSENIAQKFVNEVSENPILRQFLFLRKVQSHSVDSPTKVTITYPFCFEPTYDIIERMKREDYKRQKEKLLGKHEELASQLVIIVQGLYTNMFTTAITNTAQARNATDRENFFNTIGNASPEFIKTYTALSYEFLKTWRNFAELNRFKEYMETFAELAVKNSRAVNRRIELPANRQQILDAFSIFAKHVYLRTESLCLDCYFINNEYPPFFISTSSVRTIDLPSECRRCSRKGLVHKIYWDYPEAISKLVMPDSAWLYEIIIGYALASLDFVKEIYIHKIIRAITSNKDQNPIESDITIITKDNKLLLAEVTAQSDESNITSAISLKCENLRKSKIPYEKLMYFTSTDSESYKNIKNFKTRIYSLRHLYDLDKFVECYVMKYF